MAHNETYNILESGDYCNYYYVWPISSDLFADEEECEPFTISFELGDLVTDGF